VPEGVNEKNMIFTKFQNGESVELENYTIDPVNNTITILTEHLTIFTIMANTSPARFVIKGLTITPTEIYPGEIVTVRAIISNIGGLTGRFDIMLKIDDEPLQNKNLNLYGGASEEVNFSITPNITGEHRISIENVSGTFSVIVPKRPAAFMVSGLQINPNSVNLGENINISAVISNTGELEGSYQADLRINDVTVQTKEVSLYSGQNTMVSFDIVPDKFGIYQVSIGDLLGSFNVKPEPPPLFNGIAIRPEITSFIVTPTYDQANNQLVNAVVVYHINQTLDTFPDAGLMLMVFRDGEFLEQVPLFTLGELQADVTTGELSYIPPVGWKTGEYTFQIELYENDSLVQESIFQHLSVKSESTTTMNSWRFLILIIEVALFLGATIMTLLLIRRRKNMIHDRWG